RHRSAPLPYTTLFRSVGGHDARANQAVKIGQQVTVDIPEPVEPSPGPEALPLPIVYQDQDLIVVDKPAGMVVHPAAGHASGTLRSEEHTSELQSRFDL